jgi:hypothetical protein
MEYVLVSMLTYKLSRYVPDIMVPEIATLAALALLRIFVTEETTV